ncbi:T9SS type A sorting domain-containing protein, partial [Bacteroidota bacterium]
ESGSYLLKISNANGCINEAEAVPVTVLSLPQTPTITAEGATEFCQGDSLLLRVTDDAGLSYQWKLNGGNEGDNIGSIMVKKDGTYSLEVINQEGCNVSASNSILVTVNTLPSVPTVNLSGNTSFCEGESVTLSVSSNPDLTYQWIRDGFIIDGATSNSIVADQSGNYRLGVTNIKGCSAASSIVEVDEIAPPEQPVISHQNPATFCQGDSTELLAPFVDGLTYEWLKDGYTIPSETTHSLLVKESGTYNLKVKNLDECESFSTSNIEVAVIDTPAISLIIKDGPVTFCEGETVTLTIEENTGWTYQWYRDGFYIQNAALSAYEAIETGNYSVSVKSIENNCSSSSNMQFVNVIPSPESPTITALSDTVFCEGDSVTLHTTPDDNYTFSWKESGGDIESHQNELTVKKSGKYRVDIATDAVQCNYAASNTIEVIVYEKPDKLLISYGETDLCSGDTTKLSVENIPGLTYRWLRNDIPIPGENGTNYDALTNGTYTTEAENENNCTSLSANQVEVSVYEKPGKPTITETDRKSLICPGEIVTIHLDEYNDIYNYSWLKNGQSMNLGSSEISGALPEAEYSVVAWVGNCTAESDRYIITWKPAPEKPGIVGLGPTFWYLACTNDSANIYRWFYDGAMIYEGNEYIYEAGEQMGRYRVEISNDGDCYTSSDVLKIPENIVSIMSTYDPWTDLHIYPNPTTGVANIDMNNLLFGELIIDIFNETGKKIQQYKIQKETIDFQTEIDLQGQPSAVHLIKIYLGNHTVSRKLILK